MESTVRHIVCASLDVGPSAIAPLTGGAQNIVYRVDTAQGRYVLRLNRDYAETYAKERWAMEQAAMVGVPVPRVHAVGRHDAYDYILTDYIEGTLGTECLGDLDALYRTLGDLARRLATIPVTGFGWAMAFDPVPRFTQSWFEAVAKDRDYIFGGGTLEGLDLLDDALLASVRGFMEEYGAWDAKPALSHNDLCLDNAIIAADGQVYLIDWANACSQPSPLFEIARTGRGLADPDDIWPFAAGHGLNTEQWRQAVPTINRLAMVHALRAVVWAAQDAPQYLAEFSACVEDLVPAFADYLEFNVNSGDNS